MAASTAGGVGGGGGVTPLGAFPPPSFALETPKFRRGSIEHTLNRGALDRRARVSVVFIQRGYVEEKNGLERTTGLGDPLPLLLTPQEMTMQ